jgi:hypothetical protein
MLKTAGTNADHSQFIRFNYSEYKEIVSILPKFLEKIRNGETGFKIFLLHLEGSCSGRHIRSDDIYVDYTPTHLHLYKYSFSAWNTWDEEMDQSSDSILEYIQLTQHQLEMLLKVTEKFESVFQAIISD